MSALGLHVTAESLLLAKAKMRRKGFMITEKETMALPKDGQENGVLDEKKVGIALQSFLQSHPKLHARTVVLCFPAQQTYVTTMTVPKVQRPRIEQELHEWLPENVEKLMVHWRVIGRQRKGIDIAVLAIRRDKVEAALGVCHAAGLKVVGITTSSAALWSVIDRIRHPALLVQSGIGLPTVTLFQDTLAIDETVLPAATTSKGLLQEAEALAAEYFERWPAHDVYQFAPATEAKSKKGKKAEDAVEPTWGVVHPVLAEVPAADRVYMGAACASFTRGNVFAQQKSWWRWMFLAGGMFFIVIMTGIGVWWMQPSSDPAIETSPVIPPPIIENETEQKDPLAIDVPADHPAYEDLEWALSEGIFVEDDSGALLPDLPMVRSEFLMLIVDETADEDITAITERSGHTDVALSAPFLFHLRYAAQRDIVGGTIFRPSDPITIAEALKMTYDAYNIAVAKPAEEEDWFTPYVRRARENAIASSVLEDVFAPLTRAQAANILRNLSSS